MLQSTAEHSLEIENVTLILLVDFSQSARNGLIAVLVVLVMVFVVVNAVDSQEVVAMGRSSRILVLIIDSFDRPRRMGHSQNVCQMKSFQVGHNESRSSVLFLESSLVYL